MLYLTHIGLAVKSLSFCFLLVAAIFINGCSEEKKIGDAQAPIPVTTKRVERADVPRQLTLVGNMRPSASVEVKARVTGEIMHIDFEEGQEVKEGQPLMQIDPRPYEAVVRERRAQLARSKAQLAKASEDMRRYGKLVGNGYVSRETFDQAATDVAVLQSTVRAAEASLESGLLDLSYCTIHAPITGRAGPLSLDRGNMISVSDGRSIVSIDCLSPIYVSFSVPEVYLPTIIERMKSGEANITVIQPGGKSVSGKLSLMDNSVDTQTGTIRMRGVFPNADYSLWPGQFVNVMLTLGTERDALVVPSRSIQKGRDETYLYVVDESGRAGYRKVSVVFEHEGMSVVKGEIAEGDEVVVEGQIRLSPGIRVSSAERQAMDREN